MEIIGIFDGFGCFPEKMPSEKNKFVNEKRAVTIGRFQLLPGAGRHFLSKDESAKVDAFLYTSPDQSEDRGFY
jgi:hypothetical protein